MKWKIFTPLESLMHQCSSQGVTHSPGLPAMRGTSRDTNKHRKKKTLSSSLPKKGSFRGITCKQGKLSSWVRSVSFFHKTRLLICHIICNRNEILALFDHTLEPMQQLRADYSLIKTLHIFMYDHLLNDHPFFKTKQNFSYLTVTFFQKDWVWSQRLHVFFLKETLSMLLLTATNYSCHMQRKKHPDETIKIHTTSLKDHEPNLQSEPKLFNFLRRRINERSCANVSDWANFPTSLAGSTLTATWEK